MTPTTRPITAALLAQVRSRPGFCAFTVLIGERIRCGNTLDVQLALQEIGAPGATAHEIIEGWPGQKPADVRLQSIMTRTEIAACWLACHIDDVGRYDWPAILGRIGKHLLTQRMRREHEAAVQSRSSSAQEHELPKR